MKSQLILPIKRFLPGGLRQLTLVKPCSYMNVQITGSTCRQHCRQSENPIPCETRGGGGGPLTCSAFFFKVGVATLDGCLHCTFDFQKEWKRLSGVSLHRDKSIDGWVNLGKLSLSIYGSNLCWSLLNQLRFKPSVASLCHCLDYNPVINMQNNFWCKGTLTTGKNELQISD